MHDEDMINFDAEDKTLQEVLFSNNAFRIPPYQRPYTWGDDEINDFWNDLDENQQTYFLGSLIFNYGNCKKEGVIEIVDGQQRVLTITILLAAIRDAFKDIKENSHAHNIQTKMICFEDIRGKMKPRLICGDSAREYFSIIQDESKNIESADPNTPEHKKIRKNYEALRDKIRARLNTIQTKQDKVDYLFELVEKISRLRVIWIKIEDEDDAYEIFETVNARGVELSVSDLLKNLIFKKMKTSKDANKEDLKEKWAIIEDNITSANTEMKKFMRYYWLSKHRQITEKKLFKEMKTKITDYEDFLEDLVNNSEIYNSFIELDREDWRDVKSGDRIYRSLRGIKNMGVSQCYVLLMNLIRNKDALGTNPKSTFELVEKFTFQYSIVCKFPTNKMEKIYSKYAIKLENELKDNNKRNLSGNIQRILSDLESELKEISPTKEEFLKGFAENIYYGRSPASRTIITHLLSKIEESYSSKELEINFDQVNIEHILPQKPDKSWNVKKSEVRDYVNSIGNLTLIDKNLNSQMGNRPLKEKVKILGKSKLAINKELLKMICNGKVEWNEDRINDWQKKLAGISYNLWKI